MTQLFRESLKTFCTTLHSQDPMCSAIKHTLRDFIITLKDSSDYSRTQQKRRARTQVNTPFICMTNYIYC